MVVKTQGDSTGGKGKITKGICQGFLLSLIMFGVYTDKVMQWVPTNMGNNDGHGKNKEKWNLALSADDVKLQWQKDKDLQNIMDCATDWANNSGIYWSVEKSTVIRRNDPLNAPVLPISGKPIRNSYVADYLSITANITGTGLGKC